MGGAFPDPFCFLSFLFVWVCGSSKTWLCVFKGSAVGNLEAVIIPVLVGKDLILEGFAVEKRGQTSSRCIQ